RGHLSVTHRDRGLVELLAAYGVLAGLPRFAEPRQGRVAALRPDGLAAEEAALVLAARVARRDHHDHRRVGTRELGPAAALAHQLVAAGLRLQVAAAARTEPGHE